MRESFKTALGFGVTTGVITTLGLMVGLASGTHSRIAVIGGVLTIAIADSLSDALGIHVSEEYAGKKHGEVWEASFATLATKFFFASTFLLPVLLLELGEAVAVGVAWGALLVAGISWAVAHERGEKAWRPITEHVAITLLVVALSHYAGELISKAFG